MSRSQLVIRHRPDGTIGVLNVIDDGDGPARELAAQRAASGWRSYFPGDVIEVRGSDNAHKCRAVNNVPEELAN